VAGGEELAGVIGRWARGGWGVHARRVEVVHEDMRRKVWAALTGVLG